MNDTEYIPKPLTNSEMETWTDGHDLPYMYSLYTRKALEYIA
jgi:hypothetical protein